MTSNTDTEGTPSLPGVGQMSLLDDRCVGDAPYDFQLTGFEIVRDPEDMLAYPNHVIVEFACPRSTAGYVESVMLGAEWLFEFEGRSLRANVTGVVHGLMLVSEEELEELDEHEAMSCTLDERFSGGMLVETVIAAEDFFALSPIHLLSTWQLSPR